MMIDLILFIIQRGLVCSFLVDHIMWLVEEGREIVLGHVKGCIQIIHSYHPIVFLSIEEYLVTISNILKIQQ